ncbi:peptide/nickel transport system substrate-binding protein [Roseovarius nanhaiticus]|uniref:Peptide/nickel transport system substrate-binding protein n=1 Tax=Roseovarius nanhaiticus TaxID=573024 RepID=A0A1N7HEF6_9RHOB|nr:peptide ABC transporter substrate-binding protein [Roseovarius nanhaiticus]SEL00040.1 peptide/nickel transport system substrate-binding protein [Roseovarius nanhaiticus]SIS23143.1 peptide/nickel transport system substrate-binding protein [Roseovarius nanhaiticus]
MTARLGRALGAIVIASALWAIAPGDSHAADGQRGQDGQLRLFYWQAPSTLNPYLSGGIKDVEAASPVLEPLARLSPEGEMIPWLVQRIPTAENGDVAEDMRSITWRLKPGLVWSDGSQVTSSDIAFTHRYCTAPGAGCAQVESFRDIDRIETPDAQTAIIHFTTPKPYPYSAFVGPQTPILQAAQFAECLGPAAAGCSDANFAPIGTGPYRVTEFRPGDAALFEANDRFRTPGKPAFATVMLKGGGSAMAAGRAVLETGEFDYAWNLQLAPDVLGPMEARGRGQVVTAFSTLVERLAFNLREPGESATGDAPNDVLADRAVRRALALALDRSIMSEIGYGPAGRPACNILPGPPLYASDANSGCERQDMKAARALLDSSGWIDSDGDGVRERAGQELELTFLTSTNAVRQDFQTLAKEWWRQIGARTELRAVEAAVFFGGDSGSPDTLQKFNADIQMYAGASDGPDPEAYLSGWSCDSAPNPQNGWQGRNIGHWCDPAYDALLAQLSSTTGTMDRAAIARTLNDMLVQQYVVVPLIDRGRVSAHANSLEGVRINAWDSELWNIADWHRLPD